ncbi:Hypothetical protein PACV_146 [Pacmanvirus A23]|uniref:Hypothetical protein n=1 Tax=Pacmanvirus A23 TaxID=1932881 RepID=UPI000A091C25|nr:Hypothetical protein B9W72_gp144 [Pacmanvirus A23]SIP85861.1 Hypothetical protein PACV_146 [Pacmanvirus A23]
MEQRIEQAAERLAQSTLKLVENSMNFATEVVEFTEQSMHNSTPNISVGDNDIIHRPGSIHIKVEDDIIAHAFNFIPKFLFTTGVASFIAGATLLGMRYVGNKIANKFINSEDVEIRDIAAEIKDTYLQPLSYIAKELFGTSCVFISTAVTFKAGYMFLCAGFMIAGL